MSPGRSLTFFDAPLRSQAGAVVEHAVHGGGAVCVLASPPRVQSWAESLSTAAAVEVHGDPQRDLEAPCIIDFETSDEVADALVKCCERRGPVLAPRTPRHQSQQSLFLISIPKAGTHLLYALAKKLGYAEGIVLNGQPRPATWYCLEYSNSHTVARDFFVDSVRRGPFGNRLHPFPRTPVLFIYRNPLDILVSEAHYYPVDGNTPFAGYLAPLTHEQRLMRLIDDRWMLGSIRDRVGGFAPWLDFPNVIPISYEELVGPPGGGSERAQLDLLWSVQLKLQVGGRPEALAESLRDAASPTFRQGTIGAFRDELSPALAEAVFALPQDFMQAFGFAAVSLQEVPSMPTRADEFRRRPLHLGSANFDDEAIGVDWGFAQHNFAHHRGRYYALRQIVGPDDVSRLSDAQRQSLISGPTLEVTRIRAAVATHDEDNPT